MEYLIIDAYNVINNWTHLFDLNEDKLEDCRLKFLNLLSNYQGYVQTKIIVVFDAHMSKIRTREIEKFDNMKIVFTKEGETADNYIEKFVYKLARSNIIRVVTSDFLEQKIVLSAGGIRVTPSELWAEINSINKKFNKKQILNKTVKTNMIEDNISSDILRKLEKIRRGTTR